MTPKKVLVALLIAAAAFGFLLAYLDAEGVQASPPMRVGIMLLFSCLIFAWYFLDAQARSFRRSPWLSVAVVAAAIVAIPYYLVRSRRSGERLKSLLSFVGFVFLFFVAVLIGGLPVVLLG